MTNPNGGYRSLPDTNNQSGYGRSSPNPNSGVGSPISLGSYGGSEVGPYDDRKSRELNLKKKKKRKKRRRSNNQKSKVSKKLATSFTVNFNDAQSSPGKRAYTGPKASGTVGLANTSAYLGLGESKEYFSNNIVKEFIKEILYDLLKEETSMGPRLPEKSKMYPKKNVTVGGRGLGSKTLGIDNNGYGQRPIKSNPNARLPGLTHGSGEYIPSTDGAEAVYGSDKETDWEAFMNGYSSTSEALFDEINGEENRMTRRNSYF